MTTRARRSIKSSLRSLRSSALLLRPFGLVLTALMFDCATLSPIAQGTCGNGVVDANEDCDSFPEGTCGRPSDGARACRFTCDRTKAGSCAAGWGCGVDGVCRQATAEFEGASEPTSAGVVTLLAGDFDGDGRTDLYGGGPKTSTSKPRIHFFDSSATPAEPVSIAFPMSLPVVRDLNGDGRDDLAYAYNADDRFGAIGILSGTTDRAFTPTIVPAYLRPGTDVRAAAVPFDPTKGFATPNLQGALVTLERTSTGAAFRSISGANVANIEELMVPSTFGPEQVVAPPVSATLFAPKAAAGPLPSTCGDVVFAYNDATAGHLAILSPCAGPTDENKNIPRRWQARAPKDVTLPKKLAANSRVLVADINGGYPEVFVTLEDGAYSATSDGTSLSPFTKVSGETNSATTPLMPLAIGDLDGDGRVDLVLPEGAIVFKTPPGDAGTGQDQSGVLAAKPIAARWQDARIGRFNGDTLPDVVAISPQALEIEFFANAGSGLFTRFSVPSTVPIRAMATGDFDGDSIGDVAFLASSTALGAEDEAEAQLAIAYGRAIGGLETPRVVGRFKHARSVVSLHQANRPVDEIVVLEQAPAAGGLPSSAVTYVYGSGDRQAIAPLVFDDQQALVPPPPNGARKWQAATLVAGPLSAPGQVDLMSLAYGVTFSARDDGALKYLTFPTGAWFAPSTDASYSVLREGFRFVDERLKGINEVSFTNGLVDPWLLTAAADLDSPPDGIAEFVALVRGSDNNRTSWLLVTRKSDLEAKKAPAPLAIDDVKVSGSNDDLQLLDVDTDGLPDAIVLTRSSKPPKLRVYLNDGKGSFAVSPILVELPGKGGGDAGASRDAPLAFARLITGADADGKKSQPELAVISQRGLFLAKLKADRSGFETRDLGDRLGARSNDLTSVATGDFDGDGVQDIAVAESGSIRLVRQIPRLR